MASGVASMRAAVPIVGQASSIPCTSSSSFGASSCRTTVALCSRSQRVTRGRFSLRMRAAGEEVSTEEAEKPIVTSETDGSSSNSNNNSNNNYSGAAPFPTGRKWTGYVEKDTAGQTNIYAVEPTLYVADSVISSGEAGSSAEGSSNTAAVAFGFALVVIASASSILLTVGKKAPVSVVEAVGYNGPPLSYFISKFSEVPVEAAVTVEDIVAAPELTEEISVDEASPLSEEISVDEASPLSALEA